MDMENSNVEMGLGQSLEQVYRQNMDLENSNVEMELVMRLGQNQIMKKVTPSFTMLG